MKVPAVAALGAIPLLTGCVQHQVTESIAEHAVIEGQRYAQEVEAQSPFDTVEISWSEAEELMETRNRKFVAARDSYREATAEKPVVSELTAQVKDAVSVSVGDVLDPAALLASLSEPATQLPKQFASLGKLKDLSHQVEKSAWAQAAVSVDAELKMREERVRLHRLLRLGELIDAELARIESTPPPPAPVDPKLDAALKGWRGNLVGEREKWLAEVRDLFDAEYHDVHFVRDNSALPNYRRATRPDLGEWRRWCRLRRSHELVAVLRKAHDEQKPSIPGARLVTDRLADLVHPGEEEARAALDTGSVRGEVRSLIQNWREMKKAQQEAEKLETMGPPEPVNDLAHLGTRQQIFKLRQQEIQHASVVWMLDENCWH